MAAIPGLQAQPARLAKGPQWIEIVLEKNGSGAWKAIPSGLVLEPGDLVRFRIRTNFNGYLYVINSGTSGVRSLLFPAQDTGMKNNISAGADYTIPPSEDVAFKIAGPPGHDIVYWLLSPVPLSGKAATALLRDESAAPPPRLMPRCNDSIMRSRGDCIDTSAGPRKVPESERLPGAVESLPNIGKRDLVIMQEDERTRVSAPTPLSGPVIYEFRLAHR